jgi:hypothetical protein
MMAVPEPCFLAYRRAPAASSGCLSGTRNPRNLVNGALTLGRLLDYYEL